jgi:hypothetical protein
LAVAAIAVTTVVTAASGTAQAKAPVAASAVVAGTSELTADVAASVKGSGVEARQRALAAYWTPARMTAAKPESEIPAVKKVAAESGSQRRSPSVGRPSGPATRVSGAEPVTTPKANTTTGVQPLAYYPNYPVGHPVARTYGKVFFTSFGLNYVCSATVVNTEGKSEVWTAGHCVSDGQAWNSNWVFVPNYVNGSAPYGYWYAYQLWTTTAWFFNNNDFANDVGAVVMNRNNNWRITDYLGAQGIAWNYSTSYFMYAFGYPQAAPFNGQYLVGNNGTTYNGGGGTIYMLNNMTGGSSGGAWLNWFNGNWGYINGHNDFKYTSLPQYMYSPYYGNQVASLYNAVRYIST